MSKRQRRSQIAASLSPSPSVIILRSKFRSLVTRHEKVKLAYYELKSQIVTSLFQVGEDFTSLAIPLMKLIGLKAAEMAVEGRFTTIVFDQGSWKTAAVEMEPASSARREDNKGQSSASVEGESYALMATNAAEELMEKQIMKIKQLVYLLKQIETQENSSLDDILQKLSRHHVSFHNFISKASSYLSAINNQNRDTFPIMLKLLREIFNQVSAMIKSVEDGVQNLMQELAARMCNPMLEYVKNLRDDVKKGDDACLYLLSVIKDMERKLREGNLELVETRKKLKMEEKEKLEALCRLKDMERMVREGNLELVDTKTKLKMEEQEKLEALCKLKTASERLRKLEHQNSITDHETGYRKPSPTQKLNRMEEDKEEGDILWQMLKGKREHLVPERPMGPKDLLYHSASSDKCKSVVLPSKNRKQISRTSTRGVGVLTRSVSIAMPLGVPPSSATQAAVSHRPVTRSMQHLPSAKVLNLRSLR